MQVELLVHCYKGSKTEVPGTKITVSNEVGARMIANRQAIKVAEKRTGKAKANAQATR